MNKHLLELRNTSNDEFYTSIDDIEREMSYYDLEGLKIYCPCDSEESAFHKFFPNAICTCYNKGGKGRVFDGEWHDLEGDGDFRSDEVSKYWEWADVIITNPPFSLKTEFVDRLVKYGKRFIIVGHQTFLCGCAFSDLYLKGKVDFGCTHCRSFVHDGEIVQRSDCLFFTNMEHKESKYRKKKGTPLPKRYDGLNAYDVPSNTIELYGDGFEYDGEFVDNPVLGIPVTGLFTLDRTKWDICDFVKPKINGKSTFTRALICKKKGE